MKRCTKRLQIVSSKRACNFSCNTPRRCSLHSPSSHSRRPVAINCMPSGNLPACSRRHNAGNSFLVARLPVAPKITKLHGNTGLSVMTGLLDAMSAKTFAHHRQQFVGIVVAPLAGKAHHQRQAHDRRRHTLFNRFQHRPTPFS